MHKLLVTRVLPSVTSSKPQARPDNSEGGEDSRGDAATSAEKPVNTESEAEQDDAMIFSRATLLVASHLLNPLVFSISTRGSSESVLSLLVLATLYFAYSSQWDAAAVFLGLSTHWKIYPFVYGVACLGVLGNGRGFNRFLSWQGVRFACMSAGMFVLLGVAMYAMYVCISATRVHELMIGRIQLGVPVLVRELPIPPAQTRPPTQLLALLLPHLPHLPVRTGHPGCS